MFYWCIYFNLIMGLLKWFIPVNYKSMLLEINLCKHTQCPVEVVPDLYDIIDMDIGFVCCLIVKYILAHNNFFLGRSEGLKNQSDF